MKFLSLIPPSIIKIQKVCNSSNRNKINRLFINKHSRQVKKIMKVSQLFSFIDLLNIELLKIMMNKNIVIIMGIYIW